MSDWIFVKNSHRGYFSHPKLEYYLSLTEYIKIMETQHGLILDSLCPFEKKENVRSFRVQDKGKAWLFVLENSEYIVKPE